MEIATVPMRVPERDLPTIDEDMIAWEDDVYAKSEIGGSPSRY